MGEMIEFAANGKTAKAYLARPASGVTANGKAVLVLQEWWGLVPHIKDIADRFAREGYLALAPDFWDGQVGRNPDEAGRLFMALSIARAEKQLAGSVAALRAKTGITGKLGVVGFCMGGQLAMFAATASPADYGACVNFYGIHPKVKPDFAKLRAPVLGLFAENDGSVPPKVAHELQQTVVQAGGKMEVHIYPEAAHAFFNDTRPDVYDEDHAADAWQRVLKFFGANL